MTDRWGYVDDHKRDTATHVQEVEVLLWSERPIVVALEPGDLPVGEPVMVRLSDLHRKP